jgi:hypothetical protein
MKLLYIFLLIALPSAIFAQTNYHGGYILKNNGDTLKGYIDYREWSQSPISIDFKLNKADKEIQQFNPLNIKGFEVKDMETYCSYNGLISWDRNHFPDLAEKLDTVRKPASIFLKLITSGSHLSLYSQTDERKTRYFVAEGSDMPVELKYNQYYTERHDAIERPFFRGQLIFYINKYTPGDTGLIKQAEEAAFEDDQLEKIIYKINGDTAVRVKGRAKPSDFRGFLGIGLSYLQTKNSGIPNVGMTLYPQLTIGFDKFYNPNVQELILRASFTVSAINARVAYPLPGAPNNILKYNQFVYCVIPQVIYNVYNKDNFKVFIGAGVSVNFSSHRDSEFSNPVTGYDPNSIRFDTFGGFSFPLQTGIMINKKLEASFTYIPYNKISPGNSSKLTEQSFGLGIKVFLDK